MTLKKTTQSTRSQVHLFSDLFSATPAGPATENSSPLQQAVLISAVPLLHLMTQIDFQKHMNHAHAPSIAQTLQIPPLGVLPPPCFNTKAAISPTLQPSL
jgi:hypothetical protein